MHNFSIIMVVVLLKINFSHMNIGAGENNLFFQKFQRCPNPPGFLLVFNFVIKIKSVEGSF